jgi:drug/metabolite transporter (DMT)-like permease
MDAPSHRRAVLEALLVTFLWSTSWILMRFGLREIPALAFAGLRYATAWLVLLPWLWRARREVRALSRSDWGRLVALGVVFYALTQGGVFLALTHLEAAPLSLVLCLTPVLVAGAGVVTLREKPGAVQWIGLLLAVGGAAFFFSPARTRGAALGFALAGLTLCANAAASLLGRAVNRRGVGTPILVTGISMGIGAAILLATGITIQGFPALSATGWGIIVWLAVVNTAIAFTLWNRTLRVLSAVESSALNNTMVLQIAGLAWLFLDERLGVAGIVGVLLTAAGTTLVQLRRTGRRGGAAGPHDPPPGTTQPLGRFAAGRGLRGRS